MAESVDILTKPQIINSQSVEKIVLSAERLGINVLGVFKEYEGPKKVKGFGEKVTELNNSEKVEVVSGLVVNSSTKKELREDISVARENSDVLAVKGGLPEINRAASEDSRVDMLLNPGKGLRECGLDTVISKKMFENRVSLGIVWKDLVNLNPKRRAQNLSKIRKQVYFSKKYGFDVILCSGAETPIEMRKPRDMLGLAKAVGVNLDKSKKWISKNPLKPVERAKKTFSKNFVSPGVEVSEDES